MYQSYRNLARHAKQYFYGDVQVEQRFNLFLRQFFHIPKHSETPCHLIKHGGERRMADQLDRDFELFTYNTHPYQLHAYKYANSILDKELEDQRIKESGEKTLEDQWVDYFTNVVDTESAKLPKGEKLSLERYTELYVATLRRLRQETEMPVEDDNADFGEVRRPFGNPEGSLNST